MSTENVAASAVVGQRVGCYALLRGSSGVRRDFEPMNLRRPTALTLQRPIRAATASATPGNVTS